MRPISSLGTKLKMICHTHLELYHCMLVTFRSNRPLSVVHGPIIKIQMCICHVIIVVVLFYDGILKVCARINMGQHVHFHRNEISN